MIMKNDWEHWDLPLSVAPLTGSESEISLFIFFQNIQSSIINSQTSDQMGNKHSYAYYKQIQPCGAEDVAKHSKDITCIIQPKNNKGGLYLGNAKAASNANLLKYYGIASVLSVAAESPVHYGGIIPHHLIIQAQDIPSYDLTEHAEDAMKFVETCLKKTNVLIHCMMGVSRSASLVIWYLMTRGNLTLTEAYNLVKQKRPIINPNRGFVEQLKALETKLNQKKLAKLAKSNKKDEPIEKFPQNMNKGNNLRYSGIQI